MPQATHHPKTCRTLACCRLVIERVRKITHPHLQGLDLATAIICDQVDIEASIVGNRETSPCITPEQRLEATIRWASDELNDR